MSVAEEEAEAAEDEVGEVLFALFMAFPETKDRVRFKYAAIIRSINTRVEGQGVCPELRLAPQSVGRVWGFVVTCSVLSVLGRSSNSVFWLCKPTD